MFKTRKTNLVLILAVMITILAAFSASAAGISQKKLTLTVGSKETLKVSGAKKVKWSSSNKNIASVSGKGQVKAVKAGTAKITAKAGKKKYTCKVTVVAAKASGAAGNSKSSAAAGTAKAMTAKEKEVYKQIMAMKSIYKEGQSWGAKVFYEWDGGIFAGGLGCAAFVFMLSDIAFGSKPARIHENIQQLIWNKLFVNVALSAVTAVLNVKMGFIAKDSYAFALSSQLLHEAVTVAHALGLEADEGHLLQEIKETSERVPEGVTSICADLSKGRKTEVDTISGSVIRAAKKCGIAVPAHEFLVNMVHAMENRPQE